MPLQRTEHWRTREFYQFLLTNLQVEHVWGRSDCCLIAANAIQSFTGCDIASTFRGRYDSQASAFKQIETVTGEPSVEAAIAHCAQEYGLQEYVNASGQPQPLYAKAGDLVMALNGANQIGGVVHLNGREIVSVGMGGLVLIPLLQAQRAWKV